MSKPPPSSSTSSSRPGGPSAAASQAPRRHSPGPVYDLKPPGWRPPLSANADLGYPDFFPNRPGHGQDEDKLTEPFIRGGYVSKWGLSNSSETYSVHGAVLKSLGRTQLQTLNDSVSSLLSRRQDESSVVDPHTYKIPPRLVLHETKKQAYISDLANPAVPLQKLSRSIPHGFKGVDLLEMLANNDVSFDRALWFIKVCGGSELLSLRSAKSQNLTPQAQLNAATQASASFTTDFTNAFANFLKAQLAQLTVPSNLASVLRGSSTFSIKSSFKSILSVPANRDKWLKKWTYSNRLLQTCQLPEHSLLDRRALLSWIVTSIPTVNLAQIGFLAKILSDYSQFLHFDGNLSRTFLDNALSRLSGDLAGKPELEPTVARFSKAIQCLFLAAPHLFVSPKIYSQHLHQLDLLLSPATAGHGMLPPSLNRDDPVAQEVLCAMGEAWDAVKARNDALLFRGWGIGGGKGVWSERKGTLGDIWILDSITALSDMSRVTKAFFESLSNVQGPPSSSTPPDTPPVQPIQSAFAVKLDILLSWATAKTSSRSRLVNAQRSYAVSTILFHFLASRAGTSSQPTGSWTAVVEDEIYSWIEDSALAREVEYTEVVADVLGEMARRGVISYATYLMRLMARGMTWSTVGQGWEEDQVIPHQLRLLRSIPLFSSSLSIRHQRHVALYGNTSGSTNRPSDWQTDAMLESSKGELIAAFPEILLGFHFEGPDESFSRSMAAADSAPLETTLPTLLRAPRFVQIEAVTSVLLSTVLSSDTPILKSALLVRVIELLERLGIYSSVLDIVILILESEAEDAVLDSTIDCVKRCTQIWTAMDVKPRIVEALLERYLISRSTMSPHRPLLELLLQAADAGLLHEELKFALLQDQAVFQLDQTRLPLVFGNIAPSPGPVEDVMPTTPPPPTDVEGGGSVGKALWGRYVDASDLLKYLTRAGYEKHILSDEAELVSEALKGLEGRPSDKFVFISTQRLSSILDNAKLSNSSTSKDLVAFVEQLNGVLQIVAFSLAQTKISTSNDSLSQGVPACDPAYLRNLLSTLQTLKDLSELAREPDDPSVSSREGATKWALVVSLRLLHVQIGLARQEVTQMWTAATKSMMDGYFTVLLQLAVIHAGVARLDREMVDLLMDSLWALMEDLPKELRLPAVTPLRIFQTTSNFRTNPAIPEDLQAQLSAFLCPLTQTPFGSHLLLVTPNSQDEDAPPVSDRLPPRPWEWNEQIETPLPPPPHHQTFLPIKPVRNTASVSLSLFQAEGTREFPPPPSSSLWFPLEASTVSVDADGWSAIRSEQTYTDELESSSFARDHLNGLTDDPAALDELVRANRPSIGSSVTGPAPPAVVPPTPELLSKTKGSKRKASNASSTGLPPAQRPKGTSAADAVVLDNADHVEPSTTKGKKATKTTKRPAASTTASKAPAPSQQTKGASSKKRKNSAA